MKEKPKTLDRLAALKARIAGRLERIETLKATAAAIVDEIAAARTALAKSPDPAMAKRLAELTMAAAACELERTAVESGDPEMPELSAALLSDALADVAMVEARCNAQVDKCRAAASAMRAELATLRRIEAEAAPYVSAGNFAKSINPSLKTFIHLPKITDLEATR